MHVWGSREGDRCPSSGSGTLAEIYQTMDRVGLGESVRERLVGGTAERFVRSFWPDFDSRDATRA